MDFGLAKLTAVADVTKTLTVMGTIAYMSPEQARGEAVDLRTDIWSFGATLYEMLTGQMPFGRKHDQALIYSILNDTPEPMSRLRKDIPRPVEQLVLKTLEKDKIRRYQNMAELLIDLKAARVSGLSVPKAEKSIVVLPFEDMSPGKDNEYFSDGLTEELITRLSKILSLRVISRTSAFMFKKMPKSVKDIAQELNVGYVLEGSVRKAGNKLRIAAQLIDGTTDAHLWADHYDGVLEDVFDIQDSVSQSIVEMLKIKLTNEEKQRIAERPISNVAAYEYYLRAYPEILNGTEQTLGRAVRYLQNALDIIGDNALILSYMAFAYWMYVNIGARQEEYLTKAEEYVKRSLAIDPALGKTHVVLGWIQLFTPRAKFETGIRHFKKGLELSPEETWALQGIADIYIFSGKISAAIPICEKLLKLDPLDFHTNWIHAALPLYDGRYDEAVRLWLKFYEMFPEYPQAQFYTALALAYN
jgi:TolB-like protein